MFEIYIDNDFFYSTEPTGRLVWVEDMPNKISDIKELLAYKYDVETMTLKLDEEKLSQLDIKSSLEIAKEYQLNVVNEECTNTIYLGIDVETSKGVEHFSLTDKDQINITALYTKCLNGAPSVPYHADDTICREFSAEEMITLGEATLKYVIYCTTMCNHIRAWIQRCETVDEVIAIHFDSELPDDLQESFNSVISIGSTDEE